MGRYYAALAALIALVAQPAFGDTLERGYAAAIDHFARPAIAARADGYLYALDAIALMRYAAANDDVTLYHTLRDQTLARFLVDGKDDPQARDFVAWRVRSGQPPDASGTTEALRLAQALLAGAARFNDSGDRAIAGRVLHAYLRHAYVDRGVWLIRNYYNLQTRSFATNSYLVDYDPDTLAEAARELHDAELADGARRSYAVVARAVSAAGLLYDAIAPELETIYPLRPDVIFFSPNAITQIANTCAVARTVAVGKPDIARRVLAIGVKHARTLKVAYNVQTGAAIDPRSAGTPALACFARLADDLHDVAARRALDGAFTDNARTQLAHGPLGPELAVDVDLALRRLTDAVR